MSLWGISGTLRDMVIRRLARMGIALTVVVLPAIAQAMHPLITDDTGTQGKGAVLVESNINYHEG